jgi:hypothetical protein
MPATNPRRSDGVYDPSDDLVILDPRAPEKLRLDRHRLIYVRFSLPRVEPVPLLRENGAAALHALTGLNALGRRWVVQRGFELFTLNI